MSQQGSREAIEKEIAQRAIELYKLDHELTKEQRERLGSFYRDLFVKNMAFLYLGFIPGLSIPFIRKYQKTGSLKGVNFVWASFSGFAGMLVVPQLLSPVYFRSKFEDLKEKEGSESNTVKIVETLPLFAAIKWAEYFNASAADQSKAMKDPRVQQHSARNGQNRSGLLSSGDLFGIKQGTTYGGIPPDGKANPAQQPQIQKGHETHTWEEIRHHEFPTTSQRGSYSYQQPPPETQEGTDLFSVDLNSSDNGSENELADKQYANSWDRIRRGSFSGAGNMISSPRTATNSTGDGKKGNKTEQEKFEEMIERERNATE